MGLFFKTAKWHTTLDLAILLPRNQNVFEALALLPTKTRNALSDIEFWLHSTESVTLCGLTLVAELFTNQLALGRQERVIAQKERLTGQENGHDPGAEQVPSFGLGVTFAEVGLDDDIRRRGKVLAEGMQILGEELAPGDRCSRLEVMEEVFRWIINIAPGKEPLGQVSARAAVRRQWAALCERNGAFTLKSLRMMEKRMRQA